MNDEARTPETDLALPDDMALAKLPRSGVVAMLLDTAGTLETTEEQRAVLFAKVDADLVEIREDGIVYLPAVEFKQILCAVFGTSWAIVPESPKPVEVDGLILWGFHLFIQGQPIAFAWGEQKHQMGDYFMSYGDAMEGAKSNAIMRLCKQIGIAQDLWRPAFIRKWKVENSVEYEGVDRKTGKKKMMWKRNPDVERAESTEQLEEEADESGETKQTGDTDRFRRTAFLMVEYLQIDASRMKAECKEMFGVNSRAELEPAQWEEYRDYIKGEMDPNQVIDYERWLDVRSAIKALTERGMDKKEFKFYLQAHFIRLDILDRDLPEDLPERLKRSCASDKKYASLQQGVQRTKEWAEAVGGQGKAEELIGRLQSVLDDVTDTSSLAEFFKNLGVEPREDDDYRLTDISPAMFGGWKAALGVEETAEKKDDFLENSPNVPPKQRFLDEGEKRFASAAALEAWCYEKVSEIPTAEWEDDTFEVGLTSLLKLPLLDAENATGDAGQETAQGEPAEEQEQGEAAPEWDIERKTRREISELLEKLKVYGGPRSPKFKDRIHKLIGRELLKMQSMMETEGQDIIASLNEELEMVGEETPAEEFKQDLSSGDSERFCDTDEWKVLHRAYNDRLKKHLDITGSPAFDSPASESSWGQELTGRTNIIHWDAEIFPMIHKGLDDLGIKSVDDPAPDAPVAPKDNGLCTDDEYKVLQDLFSKLFPEKQYAMGSTEAKSLVSESKVIKYPKMFTRFKSLTTAETAAFTLFLQDKIGKIEAEAKEREKDAADEKHVI